MGNSPILQESHDSTSSTLLARAQANDPLAWERLVELYTPLVYYWCRQARLQAADAADIVQDVFHAVTRSLDRFRHETQRGSFRGWLRRITLNKVNDQWRFRAKGPEAAGGSDNLDQIQDRAARCDLDPDAPAAADENWLVLRGAMEIFRADFDESTWRAFWGLAIDNRPVADLASELSLSVNAVYKAKARVLSRLRAELRLLVDLKQMGRGE